MEKKKQKKQKKQKKLFEVEKEWEKEWKGMPEYVQHNQQPVQQIIVSFSTFEDVKAFGELINSFVSKKTKSVWFPKKNRDAPKNYRYIDEK